MNSSLFCNSVLLVAMLTATATAGLGNRYSPSGDPILPITADDPGIPAPVPPPPDPSSAFALHF